MLVGGEGKAVECRKECRETERGLLHSCAVKVWVEGKARRENAQVE